MEQFALASFNATIRFSLLCLAGLLAAALWSGTEVAIRFALLACAAAYASQFVTTVAALARANGATADDAQPLDMVAVALCFAAAVLWLLGLYNLT